MEISLRSYLTAGISLTAASAIAFTPLVMTANERAVTIPSVTVSDIQLAVTPSEITAFFTQLQDELEVFNADLRTIVEVPGATLVEGLQVVIDTNTEFFTILEGLTTNPNLINILGALELGVTDGLVDLQETLGYVNSEILGFTTEQLANLLSSTITGSLSNVLSTFVAVLNNPLEVQNYAALLSTGLVGTGQLIANNGLFAIEALGDAGFDLAWEGLDLVDYQIFNALFTVGDLADQLSEATGSDLIVAINHAVQSITLGPAQAIREVAFNSAISVLDGAWTGFNQILGGLNDGYFYTDPETQAQVFVPGLVTTIGQALQDAITVVGADPLNPENYLLAGGLLLGGGFTGFNSTVRTVGNVAQIPFGVGIDITNDVAATIASLTSGFALALSEVLTSLGLPDDIAGLPVALAAQVNELVFAGAGAVTAGLGIASGLIEGGTNVIIDVSNSIENAIIGHLPAAPALAGPAGASAQRVASEPAGEPSGDVVPVVDDSNEEDAVEEDVTEDDVPADDDVPAEDDAPADDDVPAEDDAPADDEAAGDDDSAAEESNASKSEAKKAERDAKKAERDAKKAEKAEKAEKADSDSDDSDSDSDSSDSGSESGAAA